MAIHVLSLSYGKDSLACLGAIEKLGWHLDRIVHAEVWATDTIPADLPPMVEFKAKADEIIKKRWGIEVEHVCAMSTERERERERHTSLNSIESTLAKSSSVISRDSLWLPEHGVKNSNTKRERLTYQAIFYRQIPKRNNRIYGFPMMRGVWCNSNLKMGAIKRIESFSTAPTRGGAETNSVVWYLGIASDEPERLKRLDGVTKVSPLDAIGWTEADARLWCKENDLLSPIYTTATRGGCWFCHNQGVDQLRLLRKTYPDLWALLLKWDKDSPVSFKPDGHTVHDYDRRFFYEDLGLVPCDRKFRWKMLDGAQSSWLDALLTLDP